MKFNDLEWHDSILKDIRIDRNNPGYNDMISMEIEWPDETKSIVVFEGVYQAIMDLNFGAIGEDFIIEGYMEDNDKDIENFKKMWENWNIGDIDIHMYVFQTNTSGSKIKIFAKSFRVE